MYIKSKNNPIGLDISDSNFKFAQLDKNGDNISIQSLGKIEIPPGLVQGGEIKDPAAAAEAIKKLLQKPRYGSVTSNSVVATLPDAKTFIKLINIEKGPNRLQDIIGSEIEKYVPIGIKDLYYDWQILNEANDIFRVLIGAAPRQLVRQYLDTLAEADLKVMALEIESMALCRSLLKEESPKFNGKNVLNYGLIDIGAKRTSLVIYSSGAIALSISLPISGEEVSERIAKTLEITNEQAEKAKIICGLDTGMARGIVSDILQDMIRDLTDWINETLEFFINQFPEFGPVNMILLCGGGSNIKNLSNIIKEATGIETKIADTFANVNELPEKFVKSFEEKHDLDFDIGKTKGQNISVIQNSSLSYASSIGSALRNIFITN